MSFQPRRPTWKHVLRLVSHLLITYSISDNGSKFNSSIGSLDFFGSLASLWLGKSCSGLDSEPFIFLYSFLPFFGYGISFFFFFFFTFSWHAFVSFSLRSLGFYMHIFNFILCPFDSLFVPSLSLHFLPPCNCMINQSNKSTSQPDYPLLYISRIHPIQFIHTRIFKTIVIHT